VSHAALEPRTPAASATVAVRLRDVTAGYGERIAVEEITLDLPTGSLVAIFGPNGGGKSTLLKLIAGLLAPTTGTVETLGLPAGEAARRIAYVTQAELVDWSFPVSVWDVAMMGRYPRLGPWRRPDSTDRQAVREALDQVGMLDRAQSQIGELSGGQRRRAFLARAIAADPELYLLDEPVTGVDVTTQEDLMTVLHAETERGRTVIATTHDLAAAAAHFDTVIALNRRLVAMGSASLVLDPEVLSKTYGGHLLVLQDRAVIIDDAHHHDRESGPDRHFHEGRRG
jgi:ABC-type Mn2+/Zn2+ transport system ATPase subunit